MNELSESIKSVNKTFAIVNILKDHEDAGVRELADEVGMSKSTTHRHLQTLERNGYAVCDDGRYRLSLKFLEIGGVLRAQRVILRDQIKPKVKQIAEETGELAGFMVEESGHCVLLYRVRGSNGVNTDGHLGKRFGLHHSAGGKAILAWLPTATREAILADRELTAQTPNTITDREALETELAATRERGYAIDRSESIDGLWAFGAPLRKNDGSVIGGFNVVGPEHRLQNDETEREITQMLLGITNEVELNIAHDPFY